MHTAAYLRYSSDQQREASIRDPLRNIEIYCERHGWEKPMVFQDEALSGARNDCPGYRAFIEAVRDRQFEVLLVDDLSRLSRDHIESAQAVHLLKFLGVRLIGVSDGLDTARNGYKLETSVRGLMAELYLDDLAEKTHRGLMGQALDGYSAGGLTYDYRTVPDGERGRRLEIDPEQADIIREIFRRYAEGWSCQRIVADLTGC